MSHNNTARIRSLSVQGIHCTPIDIEVDVSSGLPAFVIVGLPDAAVNESRDRVRSAIKNAGFSFPKTRVTVNLAPAHVKKVGSVFDLPIAIGILGAQGVVPKSPPQYIVGELALSGAVRGIRGLLPLAHAACSEKRRIIIPSENSEEAALLNSSFVLPVDTLTHTVELLNGTRSCSPSTSAAGQEVQHTLDLSDIVGQYTAKRALEIAAAGEHNLLLSGPPGVGKTMLARALASILPPLSVEEMIEVTMIHSLCDTLPTVIRSRPFRAPHHTASTVTILGGGPHIRPGELSLAHRGVLFLDELPEFRRDVLESLREPLETGQVTVQRVQGAVTYPAQCVFVAAHNPCPCGFGEDRCRCSPHHIERYRKKLSGPLLDRIDMHVTVTALSEHDLVAHQGSKKTGELSESVRARVTAARERQLERQHIPNGALTSRHVRSTIHLNSESEQLLRLAMKQYGLSMRGYTKVIQVSRTIADLASSEDVQVEHLTEALSYAVRLQVN